MLARRSLRLPLALGTGWATAASLVVLGSMAPAQALSAPGGLNAAVRNNSTIVLSWSTVTKASAYQVQVDTSSNFSSPDVSISTVNTHYVPTRTLPQGTVYWRVRSIQGGIESGWSKSTSSVSPVGSPQPSSPADGAHLQQPQEPPLLRWSPVQGATSYTVQVDGDVDMIGASSYTTKGTSLVVPVPLTSATGTGGHREQGSRTRRASLPPSSSSTSIPRWPAADHLPGRRHQPEHRGRRPGLDAGARRARPMTSRSPSTRTSTTSPTRDGYQEHAVLPAHDAEQRPVLVARARRRPGRPADAVDGIALRLRARSGRRRPRPSSHWERRTPSVITDAKPYFQWTPVKHATEYELQVSTDANFSPGVTKTCTTAQTTYTPRSARLRLPAGCHGAVLAGAPDRRPLQRRSARPLLAANRPSPTRRRPDPLERGTPRRW